MAEQEMRYGISALSTEYRSVAEPDELLVQQKDGRMFYKREDGQIVTAAADYDRKSLMSDIVASGISLNFTDTSYIAYHTVDISGKTSLSKNESVELGLEDVKFTLPNGSSHFCVRVRGNELTNTVISFVKILYKTLHPSDATPEITLTFEVTHGEETTEVSVDCEYNKLTYVDFKINETCQVGLKSIRLQKLASAFGTLTSSQKTALQYINMNNPKFEACTIDVATIINDVRHMPIYQKDGQIALKMLFPIEAIVDENVSLGGAGSITVSDEQPDYPGMWAKVIRQD